MPTRADQTTITIDNSTKERLYHDVMALCEGGVEPSNWDEAILLLLDMIKDAQKDTFVSYGDPRIRGFEGVV